MQPFYINEYLAVFDNSGMSSSSRELMQKERSLVLEELFPRFIPDYQKLILLSGYSHIHSGNKYIRKFADFINQLLAMHLKFKADRADSVLKISFLKTNN